MKKIFLLVFSLFLITSTAAYADSEIGISLVFDAANEDVVITGSANVGDVIIIVREYGDETALSETNHPLDIISVRSNGEYNAVLELAGTYAAGKKLTVTAYDSSGNMDYVDFANPDFDAAQEYMSSLTSAKNVNEFITILEPQAAEFGFDTDADIYKTAKSEIYSVLYATLPDNATPADVYNLYYTSCALASFGGASQSEVEKLLSANDTYFGISYDDDYVNDTRVDEASKTALCSILSDENFGDVLSVTETFADYFEKAKALANVKSAENWQDIRQVIETDFSDSFSLSSVSASNAQKVYSKMMNYTYSDFSDISSNYNKAVKLVKEENESSSRPSSGGSGGGSVGSSVSLPPVVEIEINETATSSTNEKMPMVTLPSGAESSFNDVPSNHWSYPAVSALSEAKIISGYDASTFLPSNNITRAEFTKLVCASFGIPSLNADFADVAADSWYNGFVGGATQYGIVSGYGDTFGPNDNITRQDAAVIVYRALKNEEIILNGTADFDDSLDISLYAITAVGAFKEYGILTGDGTNFYPKNNITRAEAAQLLYKALTMTR